MNAVTWSNTRQLIGGEAVPEWLRSIRAIVFDVGETLVDETRLWTDQAEHAGVTPLSFFAMLGALIERGEDHRLIWTELSAQAPRESPRIEPADLYPDAIACIETARSTGKIVGIAGNQPAGLDSSLSSLGFDVDFIASSDDWGVQKPSKEFFARVISAASVSAEEILYIGDRLDNDIVPASSVGMCTAFLIRRPWAHIHRHRPETELADVKLDSLEQLREMLLAVAIRPSAESDSEDGS